MRRTIGFSSCAVLALLLCLTASEFAAVARGIENTTPARRDDGERGSRPRGRERAYTRGPGVPEGTVARCDILYG
jgi:hypothetical protein